MTTSRTSFTCRKPRWVASLSTGTCVIFPGLMRERGFDILRVGILNSGRLCDLEIADETGLCIAQAFRK